MADGNGTDDPAFTPPIDPGDSRGAGDPGWPAIGDMRMIDGHSFRWDGRHWQRTDAAPRDPKPAPGAPLNVIKASDLGTPAAA